MHFLEKYHNPVAYPVFFNGSSASEGTKRGPKLIEAPGLEGH